MRSSLSRPIAWLVLAASVVLGTAAAEAHPHVWITARSELIYAPEDSDDYVRAVSLVDSLSAEFDDALGELRVRRPVVVQALEFLVQAFRIALAEVANFLGLHPTNVPHAPLVEKAGFPEKGHQHGVEDV